MLLVRRLPVLPESLYFTERVSVCRPVTSVARARSLDWEGPLTPPFPSWASPVRRLSGRRGRCPILRSAGRHRGGRAELEARRDRKPNCGEGRSSDSSGPA